MRTRLFIFVLIISGVFTCNCYGQLSITPNQTAQQLLSYITGPNVTVTNPVLTCPANASGTFVTTLSNLGLDSGIVLTNGRAKTVGSSVGVDGASSMFAATSNGAPGDALLTASIGAPTFDACKLEFDFVSIYDTILFYYVFGSEEYDSYSCSAFNDAFAYYISGPGYPTPTNVARIPGTNITVAINSTTNPAITNPPSTAVCNAMGAGSPFAQYYVDNSMGTTLTYFGHTTVLEPKAPVTIGQQYHMTFVVADANDGILDAGVFIRGSSFSAKPGTTHVANDSGKDIISFNPNPFKGYLRVDFPTEFRNEHAEARIFDELGQCVFQYQGRGHELTEALHHATKQLKPGLFFMNLSFQAKGLKQANKIVKVQ